MQKFSAIILELAKPALAKPVEKSSREAIAAALVLAHVAWNRVADPSGSDQAGHYRIVLQALERENPQCLRELKSLDFEVLIRNIIEQKHARYPTDNRIIRVCGLTAEDNVRVEWSDPPRHTQN
jgi:hypothetical protein